MDTITNFVRATSSAFLNFSNNVTETFENFTQQIGQKSREGITSLNTVFQNPQQSSVLAEKVAEYRRRYSADIRDEKKVEFKNFSNALRNFGQRSSSVDNLAQPTQKQDTGTRRFSINLYNDLNLPEKQDKPRNTSGIRRHSTHNTSYASHKKQLSDIKEPITPDLELSELKCSQVMKRDSALQSIENNRMLLDRILNHERRLHLLKCKLDAANSECQNVRDSITGKTLENNFIQLIIHHDMKPNILTVTLQRLEVPVEAWTSKVYAKLCLLPKKSQKQRGRNMKLCQTRKWGENFLFKKMTIGELEDCSIQVKIYGKKQFPKSSVQIGKAILPLGSVSLDNMDTTTVHLEQSYLQVLGNRTSRVNLQK